MTQCRVLVVDDEASNRTFAQVALREAGYDVTSAPDGPEALRLVEQQEQPFDLFVIDVLMPQMQGDVLAARLREIDANAKILFFTGYSGLLERAALAENQALIQKPVSLNELLETVSMMLFGHAEGMRK